MCTGMPFEINCSVELLSVMGIGFFEWNIAIPAYNNQHQPISVSPTNSCMIQPLELNSTALNFCSRSFPRRMLSTLSTDKATVDLNETVLTCSWSLLFPSQGVNGSDSVQLVIVGEDARDVNSKL